MRTSTFFSRHLMILSLLLLSSSKIFGQHHFATTQVSSTPGLLCAACTVTNPANAVDGNLQTSSTLNLTLGVLAQTYQELVFPGAAKVAAGTPVTIKLGTADNLVDLTLLGAVTIQAYNGGSAIGSPVTLATLLTAVSNNNQYEVIITPGQIYDRVRVTLNGGLLSALSSIYVYDAFYNDNSAASCSAAFDELHGISAGLLNLGVDIGGVANPQNAIDGNINTASTLNAGVNVLGAYAQQTIIFNQTSVLGDSVRLTLAVPTSLLNADVLSSISLLTFNGNTSNNDAVFLNSNLLHVQLLGLLSIGSNLSKVVVTYAPSKLFDRVQLRLGSLVANVLSTLNLYEAEKLIPRPIVKIGTVVTNSASVCAGSTLTFSVSPVANTTFAWYTTATGGSPIAGAGATFTTPALNATTTYYVGATRIGCTNESERAPVVVTVSQIPAAPVIANANATVCPGSTATFSATPVTGVTVNWYTTPSGGTPVFTGNSYTTAALNATTDLYAEAVAGGTCVSTTRTKVTATVSPLPAAPTIAIPTTSICDGDVAILSIASPVAGQTYNWYSTSTGGTVLFTGVNFTTPALHANTNYYAEAVNVTGCTSASRAQATVTVSPKPANPTLSANNSTVVAGQSATISVTNSQAGNTYNWYTSAAAATPVFTGNPYTTPLLYSSTTYYVAAVNAAGCQSATRTAITINVTINNNAPCTFANAQTNDVNGVCVLCGITNPLLATDADTTTASTLTVTAGLLGGYSEQTIQFQQAGFAKDTIRLVLQSPVGLADVGVLSAIQVSLLNGATVANTYTLDNNLITVRLLSGTNRYVVLIPATAAYDRLQIRLNSGIANLLTSLQVYYAVQQYPKPVINPASAEVCKGSPATIAITSPSPANGTFNWYATPTGGASLHTGTTYTTPNLNANTTYYVEYSRGTCVSPTRYAVNVTVDDPPLKPVVTPASATINSGQTTTFKATAATNATINWYTQATGGTPVFTGSTFTTPALNANTTYYAEAVLGNCVSPDRTVVPVTVVPLVIPDVAVTPPTQAVNAGTSATLTASSTTPGTIFNWYTTPTGGTSIFTGTTFTSPAIFSNTTYYAEAVVTATGTKSATRASGSVTVNAIGNNPVPCDAAIAQTNTTSGLLCVLCGISNAGGAIDANSNTFSQLSTPVGLLGGYSQQTLQFANVAHVGDSVIVDLGIPGSLASVGVLSQISLATYNGATYNNDRFTVNGGLLSIRLLSGTSLFRVAFKATADFDRVEVRLNSGVAGVLNALNIYDAAQEVAAPVISASSVATCAATQTTLTATVPNYVTVKWYTTATGGTPVFTGTTFNTPVLNTTTTYYAEASRTSDGCTQGTRTPVTVTVTTTPAAPVIANANATVCPGSTATFSATPVTGVTVNWYTTPSGGTPVFTGNSYTTAALNATTDLYAEAVAGGTCVSTTRTKVTATVSPLPAAPTIAIPTTSICDGDVAILSIASPVAGQTYNWYSTSTGGTVLFTGVNFTTPALHANTNYYAEAVNVTGCTSASRAQATVTVSPKPANPTLSANNSTVVAGQSATISVTNSQAGNTYNWYTSAAAATPVFTGNPYTTPLLYSSTTYYVAAVNAAGCQSATRTAITINVTINNNAPCTFANAQTNDVNGVCVLCGITNPLLATDADTTTASTLTVTAGLLGGYSEQTIQFQQAGFAKDTIRLVLQSPVGLADVGVLSAIQVSLLNGATVANTYTLDNNLITVRLLSGTNRYVVLIPATAAYDRLQIRLNSGIANLLTSLQVYYAVQQYPKPVINPASAEVCKGSPATIAITSPSPANGTFNWYATPTGGASLHTGTTYTTPNLNANTTYYVEYSRGTCVSPTRYAVNVTVDDPPLKPVVTPASATINSGQTTTFKATAATNATINWYTQATGGTPVFTGSTFTTPALNANTTYYAEAVLGNCVSPDRTVVPVTVVPLVIPDVAVTPPTQAVNAGTSATLTASSTTPGTIFNWYTTPTGGTSIFTGTTFTSPAIFSNTTYYAEAVVTATGTKSATRASGSVTVNAIGNNPVPCDAAIAQTNTTSGLLCVLCGISNAGGAIDANSNTFSQLSTPVGLLGGYSQQTLQFANVAHVGDSVIVDLGIPGSLASVGVLSQISLATYNGATYNNDRFTVNGGLLSIRLLSGTSLFRVAFKATADFDRVEVRLNSGVAGVLNALNIYDAAQEVAAPVISASSVATCAATQTTLTATVPNYVTVKWYTTATGGTPVFTGTTFNTPVLNTTTTYYAEASRTSDGCTQGTRTPVTVTVTTTPAAPVIANANATVCPGSTATFSATPVTGVTVNWYTTPSGGTPVFTGNSYTTAALNATTDLYAEAVAGGTCVSTTRTKVTATVSPLPAAPTIAIPTTSICDGDVAILSIASPVAGQTYNWYSTSTGGTVLFTGVNFTTPALHANTNYYAEAVNVTGCTSASRAQATVTVSPKPANPVLAANNLTIAAGQSATISVTNAQTGITYNWYTSAAAATPVFTGTTYTTPLLYSSTTYYVAGVNAAGCQSAARTAVTINVTINNNAPCSFANQQTNDVNGVCLLCGITNPLLATDADTTTASTLTVTAGLLGGYSEQTVQFQQAGFAGDTIRLVLQSPVGLADVGVLSAIQVSLLNGATVGSTLTLDNNLITVRLLSGTNRYVVLIPATAAYDRLRIRLNSGVANLLTSLQVYYALQQYPKPVFNPASTEVCKGSPAVVSITAPSPANGTFNWYATPTGGASLHTGTTYTTPNLNANTTYYVEYSRGTCVSPTRYAVNVTVDDPPAKPTVIPASASINPGQTATFKATAVTNAIIKWYTQPTGGTAVFTGSTFTTPALSASTTYYAESVLGNCVSPDRTVVPVTVTPLVIPDVAVAPPTQAINAGTSATLTASSTTPGTIFNWYTTPTGGTSIYTGATFTSPPLFAATTYYAEAVVSATGSKSATRASGSVTINAISNNPVPCDAAIDQTNTTSGLLCLLCGINNATGSVDANSNTFAQLSTPVGLLGGYSQQTLRFANTGRAGDTVVVDLGIPGALASVGVLSQISLATYNGATYNNDRFTVNGSLLSIQLLSGTSRFRVTFKAAADFDRVEVRLNSGVAGVLNALNIYDAAQEVAAPVITANAVTACAGTQTTLTATVPSYVTVKWYTTATGGSPVFTGATFNTPVLNSTTTYYAEASRTADGCTQATRTPVKVTVTPTPAAPVVAAPNVTICSGSPATFAATPVNGVTFNWYTAATGGTLVHTGNSYTTGALSQTTSYFVEAAGAGSCGSSTRTQVTANVTATPLVPQVAQATVQTCSGSSAVLSATSTQPGVTFNWYTTATGGTPIFTGAQYTTPNLTANTSYYVEAAAGSCVSSTRAKTDVVVNPTPVAPTLTVTPANAQISSGQTAVIKATSTTVGATFNWYTAASGGSPIFTGATFTTPALTSNMTYYVESTLAATGCTSPTRTPVTITVNPIFSTSCDFASTQNVTVTGACVGCTVSTPNNAVDSDTTNASQLQLTVGLLGANVSQQLIFGDTGSAGDSVTVKLGLPVSLLTAGVLDGIQIASYNGVTDNNDRITLSSNLVHIRLLAGSQTAIIRFAPKGTYDRVEVTLLGGVLSALNSASIYYATKQVDAPKLAASTDNICQGSTATFTVSNARASVTYKWYTAAVGGSLVHTGATFTTGALAATTTYYVESSRTANGCVNPNRVAATANVTPSPVNPVLASNNVEICAGDNATLTVTNAGTATVKWYDAATNGTLLFTGATYTVNPVTTQTYYAELSNGTCTSPARTLATVKVNARPSKPGVVAADVQVCANSTAVLAVLTPEAGVTYSWYTAATGGTAAGTGATFTTPAISQNITYYVEASNTTTGCINNGGRTPVNITVSGTLTAPTLSAATTQVCSGGSVTVSVNNPVAGLVYNWYTAATGGTPIFTGTTFTANNLLANISYFVEAANSSGCVSSTRAKTDITVLPIPTPPQVTAPAGGLSACDGSTITISITNPQADQVYRWYNFATGGTLLFTGTQFTTPVITATTTYYVEAASAGNCNPSARTPVKVTLNPLPADPTVTASTVPVCAGGSATLSVASPQAGITYTWYDSPAMTTVLFTGSTYITGPISTSTNFYVSAANTSGCNSNNLAQVRVNIIPPPSAPVVAGGAPVQTCVGSKATLSIDNPTAGFTYNWYTAATGGTPIFTGTSFTTANLSADISYYAEAVNSTGCGSSSRTQVDVHVNALPVAPVVTAQGGSTTPSVCSGNSATLIATSVTQGVTFNWYTVAQGGTPVFTGATYVTPPISATTTYYVEAVTIAGGCASSTRTAVQVTVGNTTAPTPTVDAAGLTVCQNSVTTINVTNPVAGTTYNFYTVATGGNAVYTGTSFVTPAISQNTTYYVEATDAQDCKPSVRLAVNVVIVPQPGTPVPTAATVAVCIGSTATLSVSSPQAALTYNWYSSAAKTTKLFTGVTYVTGPINANTTFYVEAANGSCSSSALATVQVNVNSAPGAPALVNNAVIDCQGSQATLSIANPQAGFTYSWYANATGGSPLFTGTNFVTPALSGSATYYAEAINSTGCSSVTRTSASVTVTPGPNAPQVNAPTVAICSGATATLSATASANTNISWYLNATGGAPIAVGASFTTAPLSNNTTYYAEAANITGGCVSATRTAVTVTIIPALTAPVVSASNTTASTITFTWAAIPGATGYEVSLDNGATFIAPSSGSAGTTHEVSGLTANQTISIIVRATGPCGLGANSAAATGTTTNPFGNGIFIPNVFTPNGDGNNDVLQVYGTTIQSLTLSIYDQWGELQFRTTNKSAGWDGTYKGHAQPVGVYVYYVTGTTNDGQPIKLKGTVTLLR